MNQRLELHIVGRVQGVAFRSSAKQAADKLGITGYAKNLPDGSVEIVAEGKREALQEFLQWSFRGPFLASVEGLTYEWKVFDDSFTAFEVLRVKKNIIKDQIRAFKSLGNQITNLPKGVQVPEHIALICDGNRRWAKQRGLPTIEGHRVGFDKVVKIAEASRDYGVRCITLWMFSTENWNRDEFEVKYLMNIFRRRFSKFSKSFHKDKVRFTHMGRKDRLPSDILETLNHMEEETKNYDKYYLNIALDYGGQDEILRAIKKGTELGIDMTSLSAKQFEGLLDTSCMPAPDLIIRTSGEQRLSGLMSWQSAYAEYYFTSVNLPDFGTQELKEAILEYSYRNRRFGGNHKIKSQLGEIREVNL
jgi:undecaprenyl diphosphate synthase